MAAKKKADTMEFTKFEKARVLGSRALQIFMGAPFEIKLSKADLESIGYNPIEIAKKELAAGKLPIEVVREVRQN